MLKSLVIKYLFVDAGVSGENLNIQRRWNVNINYKITQKLCKFSFDNDYGNQVGRCAPLCGENGNGWVYESLLIYESLTFVSERTHNLHKFFFEFYILHALSFLNDAFKSTVYTKIVNFIKYLLS